MLDLDDVGTPVGQDRARERDEDEGRHLDDLDSAQHLEHDGVLLLSCPPTRLVRARGIVSLK